MKIAHKLTALFLLSVFSAFNLHAATTAELEQKIKKLETEMKKAKKRHYHLKGSVEEKLQKVEIHGFATAAIAKSNEAVGGPEGVDDEYWRAGPDTMVGLQIDYNINEKVSFTWQGQSNLDDDDYDLNSKWAYFTYQFSPKLKFRGGRLIVPFYMLSDFLDVGYSYNWVRLPHEAYNIQATNMQGFDLLYNTNIFGFAAEIQAIYGSQQAEQNLSSAQSYFQDNQGSLILNLYKGNFRFRIGSTNSEMDISFRGSEESLTTTSLAGALEGIRPTINGLLAAQGQSTISPLAISAGEVVTDDPFASFDAMARLTTGNELQAQGEHGSYVGVGVDYNDGKLQVMSEVTRGSISNSVLPAYFGGYVMVGYRITPKLTPFFSHSREWSNTNTRGEDTLNAIVQAYAQEFAAVSDPDAATHAGALGLVFQGLLNQITFKSQTNSIGIRYDVISGMAIKAQFDQSTAEEGYASRLGLSGDGIDKATTFTFAIDTAF